MIRAIQKNKADRDGERQYLLCFVGWFEEVAFGQNEVRYLGTEHSRYRKQ